MSIFTPVEQDLIVFLKEGIQISVQRNDETL